MFLSSLLPSPSYDLRFFHRCYWTCSLVTLCWSPSSSSGASSRSAGPWWGPWRDVCRVWRGLGGRGSWTRSPCGTVSFWERREKWGRYHITDVLLLQHTLTASQFVCDSVRQSVSGCECLCVLCDFYCPLTTSPALGLTCQCCRPAHWGWFPASSPPLTWPGPGPQHTVGYRGGQICYVF